LTGPLPPIPRTPYAVLVGGAAVLSVGLGTLIAAQMGAPLAGQVAIAAALILGALLAAIPLLPAPLITPERWGMAVLAVSGARTMAALGAMLILIELQGLPRKPVVYAILAGTFVMMLVEAMAAVWFLSRRDRLRAPLRTTPAHGSPS
jgi:hypothetical protein